MPNKDIMRTNILTILLLLGIIMTTCVINSLRIYEGVENNSNIPDNGNIQVGKLINMDYVVNNYTDKEIDETDLLKNLSQLNVQNSFINTLINKKDVGNIVTTGETTLNKLDPTMMLNDSISVLTRS